VVLVAVGETEAAVVEAPGAAEDPVVVAADSEAAAVADQAEVRGADSAVEVELAAGAEAAAV